MVGQKRIVLCLGMTVELVTMASNSDLDFCSVHQLLRHISRLVMEWGRSWRKGDYLL